MYGDSKTLLGRFELLTDDNRRNIINRKVYITHVGDYWQVDEVNTINATLLLHCDDDFEKCAKVINRLMKGFYYIDQKQTVGDDYDLFICVEFAKRYKLMFNDLRITTACGNKTKHDIVLHITDCNKSTVNNFNIDSFYTTDSAASIFNSMLDNAARIIKLALNSPIIFNKHNIVKVNILSMSKELFYNKIITGKDVEDINILFTIKACAAKDMNVKVCVKTNTHANSLSLTLCDKPIYCKTLNDFHKHLHIADFTLHAAESFTNDDILKICQQIIDNVMQHF